MQREHSHFRLAASTLLFVAVVLLTACSNMSNREQRMLSGGAIGAGGGALIGEAVGGSAWTGAAIGAAVGTAGGYLYDREQSN